MDDINLTRRNMRYMGQIESKKYNDLFNEAGSNLNKIVRYYKNNLMDLSEDIEEETSKKEELKKKLYSLNNKRTLLEEYQGGVILE